MRTPSRAHANLNLLTTPSSSPRPYNSITLRRSSLPQVTLTLVWPLKSPPARAHISQRTRTSAGPSASAAWRIRMHRGGSAAYGCPVRSDSRCSMAFAVINAACRGERWQGKRCEGVVYDKKCREDSKLWLADEPQCAHLREICGVCGPFEKRWGERGV